MRELVTADSFKIVTLLFTLSSDLDDQMNIITLRNLIYEQVTAKLSGVAARNKLKKKKNEKNKAFSSTSFKNKRKKKTNSSLKNDDTKVGCIYYKKHFLKFKWSDHTWNECRKLKAAKKKKNKDEENGRSEQAALADEKAQGARPTVSLSFKSNFAEHS
jgi:hypothetical protein